MEKLSTQLGEIKLAGITTRTSNALEMDPRTAKIGLTLNQYFAENPCEQIANRVKPGTTYCVYTNYQSDASGEYTYFVGEAVESFDNIDTDLETLIIPQQNYTKFTVGPGEMPTICIDAWQAIWQMGSSDLSGERQFVADFEVYDERASDPKNTLLDIFIGVK